MPRPVEDRSDVGGAAQFNNIGPVPLSRFEGWAEIKMPRPVEDRSDVGGAAQFINIGPVPLSRFNIVPVTLSRLEASYASAIIYLHFPIGRVAANSSRAGKALAKGAGGGPSPQAGS